MDDSPFERPTDRVRKIMPLAREHAARLGHAAVEPGHVFLAILEEGTGVAAAILREHAADFGRLRGAIEEALPAPGGAIGPELPFAPGTRALLEAAEAASRELGHDHIGSEHVLLGLADCGDPVLGKALPTREPAAVQLRREVRIFVGDLPAD